MNEAIQFISQFAFIGIFLVAILLYLRSLKTKSNKILEQHTDSSSEIFGDLKVWFKNYDVFKKKNKFDLNPNDTLFGYNYCDLILNDNYLVVIGKMKSFGFKQSLIPTIFEFKNTSAKLKRRHVRIKNIQEVDKNLEIEFLDDKYPSSITLVIIRADPTLKQSIINRYKTMNKME